MTARTRADQPDLPKGPVVTCLAHGEKAIDDVRICWIQRGDDVTDNCDPDRAPDGEVDIACSEF